jgi:hypothetical protein
MFHRTSAQRISGLLLSTAAAALTLVAPPAIATALAAIEVVRINFDVGTVGQPAPATIPSIGAEPDIAVSVVTRNGGVVLIGTGRAGNGRAVDLPAHDGASTGARGVIKVIDSDLADGDALSPGLATFTFGADFKLDAVNASTSYDNGNNLIQRGLAGSGHQYKLQVDNTGAGPKASCGLEQKVSDTETRTAFVTSTVIVDPTLWYRVRCTRQDTTLTVVVTPYNPDGTAEPAVTTAKTAIPAIDLTWPVTTSTTPMSIGGKLNATGAIAGQSDQFNGLIDNAVLIVG